MVGSGRVQAPPNRPGRVDREEGDWRLTSQNKNDQAQVPRIEFNVMAPGYAPISATDPSVFGPTRS